MSWTVDATDWTRQLSSPLHDGNNPKSLRASIAAAISMSLSLTTAGRLGFFIDYSELETVGTHNFYVTRTHGSQGAVGCTWTAYDSADGAQLATGSLSWANHSLDVLSFQVPVTSKPAGDHRIYVLLSNPTGGAALHHGDSTIAYGIIDDDTIATSNAIFIDADAVTNGTGTQASPYNNWYSARDAVLTTTRVVYIKGLMVPDSTDDDYASLTVKHLKLSSTFEGRASESQRLVIRNWPNFVGGINGNGQDEVAGFLINSGESFTDSVEYITFKGLTITNLRNEAGGIIFGRCEAIRLLGGLSQPVGHVTGERLTISNLLSGSNAATAVWYNEQAHSLKMWGCTITNTLYANKDTLNLLAFETYGTPNCSIQNNFFSDTAGGIFEKEGLKSGVGIGMTVRFNVINSGQIYVSTQGGSPLMDWHIFSHNILNSTKETSHSTPVNLRQSSTSFITTKTQIYNNVFYDYDYSSLGHITVGSAGYEGLIMFNNMFHESDDAIRIQPGTDAPEYWDYNFYQNNVLTRQPRVANREFPQIDLATLQSTSSYEQNAVTGNPVFVDVVNGNFTLAENSPAISGGLSGTTMGAFAQDFIKIGAN
jgi:hypothetical protein